VFALDADDRYLGALQATLEPQMRSQIGRFHGFGLWASRITAVPRSRARGALWQAQRGGSQSRDILVPNVAGSALIAAPAVVHSCDRAATRDAGRVQE
jgi:hypothetical protein